MNHDELEQRLRRAYQDHADTVIRAQRRTRLVPPEPGPARRPPRWWPAILATAACLVLLVGSGLLLERLSSHRSAGPSTGSSHVPNGSTTDHSATPAASTSAPTLAPASSHPPTPVDPAQYNTGSYTNGGPVQVMPDSIQFSTPSHNIRCVIFGSTQASLTCEIAAFSYQPPPRPASCRFLNWAGGYVSLEPDGPHVGKCTGDEGVPYSSRVLPYGYSISELGVTCVSTTDALQCRSSSGHGFALSRQAATTF